ncbi:MAG: hypothetical protein ACOCTI_01320 [Phycisphaeraceae bacterium]
MTQKRAVKLLLGPLALAMSLSLVGPEVRAAQADLPEIGINLSGVRYYARELPFIDLMKGAGWNKGTPFNYDGDIDVRDDGYPSEIRSGQAYRLFDKPAGVPGGRYVLLYDGQGNVDIDGGYNRSAGRIEVSFEGSDTKSRRFIRIHSTDAGDPVRNMRLVPAAQESTYRSGTPEKPFRQQFLDNWDMMDSYRYMDWQDTNASPLERWDQRTLPTDSTQASDYGVALEHQIQLSNQTGKKPWFTVPHLADDNYIRNMATMIRDNLDPNLNARIEYSNEVWNWSFEQAHWAATQGVELGLDDEWGTLSQQRFYAQRSKEMFQIFEDVFTQGGTNPDGLNRLTRVLSGHAGNSWVIERALEHGGVADHVDAIAIAPYIQGTLHDQSETPGEVYNATGEELKEMTWEERFDWYWGQLDKAVEDMESHAQIAEQLGVDLFAYEGGQHLVAHGDLNQDTELVNLFMEMNRRPEMRELYRRYLEEWERVGGDDFMLFASTSGFGSFGSWGLKEYEDQPLSETPKLQGVLDYLAAREEPIPEPAGLAAMLLVGAPLHLRRRRRA